MRLLALLLFVAGYWVTAIQENHNPLLFQTTLYNCPDWQPESIFLGPPVWSPDGESIAFRAENLQRTDIWMMDYPQLSCLRLTANFEGVGRGLSWSQDSEKLTFAARAGSGGVSDIWMINRDGSQPVNLTEQTQLAGELENARPVWSPDGRYIGFEAVSEDRSDIIILDVETHGANNITDSIGTVNREISWSPDSHHVAFYSSELLSPETQDWSLPEVLVASVDGSQVTSITQPFLNDIQNALPYEAQINTINGITWSPTGSVIAFSVIYDLNADIFLIDYEQNKLVHLTEVSFFADLFPAWSPDGSKIAFVMDYLGDETDIWAMRIDEKLPENLTSAFGKETRKASPCWSPDGKQIAFESNNEGTWNLWIMEPDGANPTKLINRLADQ